MSRDKLWYLLHPDDRVTELDIKLDRIDIEIDGLRRIRYEETKARLEALGIDVSNYRPPPPLTEREQRCRNHIRPDDDVEAIVTAAKQSPLDRLYREHLARPADVVESPVTIGGLRSQTLVRPGIGQVLGVR